jgi:hypothetical protein
MTICVFKTADLKRCVEHALNSKEWRMGYAPVDDENPAGPGLFLVHDQGVYLMSNGEPGDALKHTLGLYVAYAEGCHPDKNEDWWDTSRALVGGDDFAEIIKIDSSWLAACDENDELHVAVTPTEFLTRFADSKEEVRT